MHEMEGPRVAWLHSPAEPAAGYPAACRRPTAGLAPTGHWYPPGSPVARLSRRSGGFPGWPAFQW